MSTRTSDFDLIVGADIQASADQLVKDIEAAIKLVNGTPRKIKLELDDSLIKTQLTSIKDQIAALNGQKIEIKAGSEFGNIIKASGTLSESIKKASTNIKTLSDEFRKLASNSGAGNIVNDLQQVTPVIESLKSEITSLQTLMKDFNGISINLNPGGGNSVLRTAQYGTSARQTISELQAQAREIEKIFESLHTDKITGKPIYSGVEALFKVVQGTDVFKGKDIFSIIENVNNPKGSLSSRMDALREYIHLYEKAASARGIDISSATSTFAHGADELVEKTRKIQSGEADLEAATERLRKVFGSGLDAEALATQLAQINESINGVVKAIESIGTSGKSMESIATSVTTISQSLTDLLSKLEAVNKVGLNTGATPINQVKQQISEAVAQVSDISAEDAKYKAILDSASAGAVKTGEAVRGAAQTVKESFDTINFDTPISKAAELKSVLVSKGVEETFADKIARDMVEATGEVSKLSLSVDKLQDGTVTSARVVVDSFDKMKNALRTTVNYKLTADQDGNPLWHVTSTDRVTKSIDTAKQYQALLEKISQTSTKTHAFLDKNVEAKNISEPYKELIGLLQSLDSKLKECGGDAEKLKTILAASGSDGIKGVENSINRISNVTSAIKNSLSVSGVTGDSLTAIQNQIKSAKTLLNNNKSLSGEESYIALSNHVDILSSAIKQCRIEGKTLEEALKGIGLTGTTALSENKRLMSDFGITISTTGAAAKENERLLKEREALFDRLIGLTTKARGLLGQNTEVTSLNQYQGVVDTIKELESVVSSCAGDFTKLDDAIASSSYKSVEAIKSAVKNVDVNLSEMKHSLTTTGLMGDPLTAYKKQIETARNLLNNNKASLSSESSFIALSEHVNKVSAALELCKEKGISLSTALEQVGLESTTAFTKGRGLMADFGLTISNTGAAIKEEAGKVREYKTLINDMFAVTTKARSFVTDNTEASKTAPYKGMIETIKELEGVLESCAGDFTKLDGTISSSMYKSAEDVRNAVGSIETNLSEMKHSLTTTGLMGDPLTAYKEQIKATNNLLNNNDALRGTETFGALSKYASDLTTAIERCKDGSMSLGEAFKSVGLDAKTALVDGKRLMTDFGVTVSQVGTAAKEEAALLKNRETIQNAANTAILNGEKALKNWSAAEHSRNTESREAYAALRREVEQLKAAANGANNDANALRNLQSATNSVNGVLKQTEATLVRNGTATEKFSAKIGNLVQKFSSWFSITQVIMYTIRSIRKMISASVELNSALTQMQIVTKASDSEMRAFSESAAKAAKRVGSDITDFVSSATTYARLGQTMEESQWMAEYTAKLQALGEIDVSDAQNAVTSIIKAFDIDPMQIDKVMDKLITVGKQIAQTCGDIC